MTPPAVRPKAARRARGRRWPSLWAALALALALAWPAAGQPGSHLAVVLDSGAAMTANWQGASRLAALAPHLATELASLPLAAKARLWVCGAGRAAQMPLARGRRALAPALGGAAPLDRALAQALSWLRRNQGGAVLLISGGTAPGLAALSFPERDDLFLHLLALGPAAPPAWDRLALAGGGGVFEVVQANRLPYLLHQAVLRALSPQRLKVLAHAPDNRALHFAFGLARPREPAARPAGKSGRTLQLVPAVYRLIWPDKCPAGPKPLPARVRMGREGLTLLYAGGVGRLSLSARDGKSKKPKWRVNLIRHHDGKVLRKLQKIPATIELAAGRYRVTVINPFLSFDVLVAPARKTGLLLGRNAQLTARLAGPAGPWRLAYRLVPARPLGKSYTGYGNARLLVQPGDYRLQMDTAPPLDIRLSLAPEEKRLLDLPRLGALLLKGRIGARVLDSAGDFLALAAPGRRLPMLPGSYGLAWEGGRGMLRFKVRAGKVTTLSPPRPKAGQSL